jgi:hypothetical protein
MAKTVVLITKEALSPYNVNEVFSVGEEEAKALLDTKKVAKFDPKNSEHAAALVAQRGKTEDVEVEEAK